MPSVLSLPQRNFLDQVSKSEYRKHGIDAYYLPFQSNKMSHVFLVDTIKCLMVGGRVLQVEVFHSRLDLMAKIPFGYFFDERIDLINHWFVILRTQLRFITIEKFRSGIYIQISKKKNDVKYAVMGVKRRAVRLNKTMEQEINLPDDLNVEVAALIDTIATGVAEKWTITNNCTHFVRQLVSKMK